MLANKCACGQTHGRHIQGLGKSPGPVGITNMATLIAAIAQEIAITASLRPSPRMKNALHLKRSQQPDPTRSLCVKQLRPVRHGYFALRTKRDNLPYGVHTRVGTARRNKLTRLNMQRILQCLAQSKFYGFQLSLGLKTMKIAAAIAKEECIFCIFCLHQ